MAKVIQKDGKERTVFADTSSLPLGIIGVVSAACLMSAGFFVDDGTFKYIWFGLMGLFGIIFLWFVISPRKQNLYIEDGALHWVDERSTNIPGVDEGTILISQIASYRVLCKSYDDDEDVEEYYEIYFRLQDGTEQEMPPNIARRISRRLNVFHEHLLKYNPELVKSEIEERD